MAPSLPPKATTLARSSAIPYAKPGAATRRSDRSADNASRTRERVSLSAPPGLAPTKEVEIVERVASPTPAVVPSSSELEPVESAAVRGEERILKSEPEPEILQPSSSETVEPTRTPVASTSSARPSPKRSSSHSSFSSKTFFGCASHAIFAAANKMYSASPEVNLSASDTALAPSSSNSSSSSSPSKSTSLSGFAVFAASQASLSDRPPFDTPETPETPDAAPRAGPGSSSCGSKGKKRAYEPEQDAAEGVPDAAPRPTKALRDRKSGAFAATSPAILPSTFVPVAYSRHVAEAELSASLSHKIDEQKREISNLKKQLSLEQAKVEAIRKEFTDEYERVRQRDAEIERLKANIQEVRPDCIAAAERSRSDSPRKFLDSGAGALAFDDSGFASDSDSDDDDYLDDVIVEDEYESDSDDEREAADRFVELD